MYIYRRCTGIGCSQLDEQQAGSHEEARAENGTSTCGTWLLVSPYLGFAVRG